MSLIQVYSVQEQKALLKTLKMGTREWCTQEINICRGCLNDCVYCYARNMAYRMKRIPEFSVWNEMTVNSIDEMKIPLLQVKKGIWDFMFQSTSDIFNENIEPALRILKQILLKHQTVLITTKPRLNIIQRLCAELHEYKDLIAFRFTIGSIDSQWIKVWERNASSFEERLSAMEFAYTHDFRTTVSAEPLLDADPSLLIAKLQPFLSPLDRTLDLGTIWLGLMKTKYIPKKNIVQYGLTKAIQQIKAQQTFPKVFQWYSRYFDVPFIRMKESVKKLMIKNNIKVKVD